MTPLRSSLFRMMASILATHCRVCPGSMSYRTRTVGTHTTVRLETGKLDGYSMNSYSLGFTPSKSNVFGLMVALVSTTFGIFKNRAVSEYEPGHTGSNLTTLLPRLSRLSSFTHSPFMPAIANSLRPRSFNSLNLDSPFRLFATPIRISLLSCSTFRTHSCARVPAHVRHSSITDVDGQPRPSTPSISQ